MTKSTINAACTSILIIIEENKKLMAIANKLMDQGLAEEANEIFLYSQCSYNKLNHLIDFLNKKSLTVESKYYIP